MNPLGPLNGKSFCTTVSPWVITLEALAPFKASVPNRKPNVELANYLRPHSEGPAKVVTYDLNLSAEFLPSNRSNGLGDCAATLCETRFSSLYWTLSDLVAQQTINGCNLNVGDLLATGTISGESFNSRGCLMERPDGVKYGIDPDGHPKVVKTLGDGDTLLLIGIAGDGVGFGECVGTIICATD
jgi:fumarylacetoacetase